MFACDSRFILCPFKHNSTWIIIIIIWTDYVNIMDLELQIVIGKCEQIKYENGN